MSISFIVTLYIQFQRENELPQIYLATMDIRFEGGYIQIARTCDLSVIHSVIKGTVVKAEKQLPTTQNKLGLLHKT